MSLHLNISFHKFRQTMLYWKCQTI